MQASWSEKDERQYEEIKKTAEMRDRTTDRAEEIAARTVNNQRRREGRSAQTTTSGTGSPFTNLEARSKEELLSRARELAIPGRSTMNKKELIEAIRNN